MGDLHYLISDLLDIGFFSGENAISDREIYYHSKLHNKNFKPFECRILKECAQVYVSSFYKYNDTIEPSPLNCQPSQEELDKNDELLMQKMLRTEND